MVRAIKSGAVDFLTQPIQRLLGDDELEFDEAVSIYCNRVFGRDFSEPLPQPCAHLSELIDGIWHLRNEDGLITQVGTGTNLTKKSVKAAGAL